MNRAWILAAGLAAGSVVGSTGCHGTGADKTKVQGRSQVGEDPIAEFDASTTVGQKTSVGNIDPIVVSGVGLVYGLPGTGSSAVPGTWRMLLENNLKKQGFSNMKELLDDPSKTTSLVLVSALIPPGARKGDPIDVQISLPDESKTTSLKGGRLFACELFNTDSTGNIKSTIHEGRTSRPSGDLKLGDVWARVEGQVIAGQFIPTSGVASPVETDADGQPLFKIGRIWGGGKITKSRPYFILLNPGDQNTRMASTIAERLNSTFHATTDPNLKVAEAKSRELILVNVPAAYRNNPYRFLLVARQVPILARPDSTIRRKLEDDLLDPATTITAAIKLEAMGNSSMRTLRVGLESPSPWVRFASAEALTYLGQTDGAAELARLAEDHPALRAPSLKALATMDDAACTDRLTDLMASPNPMLRYGAFIALRLADENTPAARGQLVNNSFWLHSVATGSPGMVHLTTDRRCEVVLFGDNLKLRGPFTLPVGSEFTVHVPPGGGEATVTRIVKVKGDLDERKLTCPTDLYAVLLVMGKLGGGYGEAVELIRRADRGQVLTGPVVVDAIPAELNVRQLNLFARQDPALTKANGEVVRAGVVRPGLDNEAFDLPPQEVEPAAVVATPTPVPQLNRNPGRLFGPKRHDVPAIDPAGGQ